MRVGEIGDEVELVPETVQFLFAFVVEDQFHQRRVVAEVAHHVVIAGAEQTALVLRIVGEEAAALADVEGVREDRCEAREGGFIAWPLGGGNDQIGIARAGFRHDARPSGAPLPGGGRDTSESAGTTGGGSVSLRRAFGSKSRRCELNSRSFQFSSGCDAAGRPSPPARRTASRCGCGS